MKIFECGKCNSKNVFVEQNGNNTGLYCADCGKWITWLNKDGLRLAERQINANEQEIRNKAIDEFAEELYKKSTDFKNIESDDYGMLHYEDVYKIAEKMKGE